MFSIYNRCTFHWFHVQLSGSWFQKQIGQCSAAFTGKEAVLFCICLCYTVQKQPKSAFWTHFHHSIYSKFWGRSVHFMIEKHTTKPICWCCVCVMAYGNWPCDSRHPCLPNHKWVKSHFCFARLPFCEVHVFKYLFSESAYKCQKQFTDNSDSCCYSPKKTTVKHNVFFFPSLKYKLQF